MERSTSIESEDTSVKEIDKVEESNQKSLITEERAETGRVTFAVILAYCRACTWYMTVFVLVFNILSNVFAVVTNFWLADWSNAEATRDANSDGGNHTVVEVTACDSADSIE